MGLTGIDCILVSTAVKSRCDYFVTGDKQILRLKRVKDMQIVTAADFLRSI